MSKKLLTREAFAALTLREMHDYLEELKAAVIIAAYTGDNSNLPQLVDVDTVPDGDGLADAVDAWLAGGAS